MEHTGAFAAVPSARATSGNTYVVKAKRKVEGAAPICGGLRCGGWAVRARRREETSSPDPPNAIYRQ